MLKKINQEVKFEIGSFIVSSLPLISIIAATASANKLLLYTPIFLYIAAHIQTLYKYDVRKHFKTYNTTNIHNGIAGRIYLALTPLSLYISNSTHNALEPYELSTYLVLPIITTIEPIIQKTVLQNNSIIFENIKNKKNKRLIEIQDIITWHLLLNTAFILINTYRITIPFSLELITITEATIILLIIKSNNSTKKNKDIQSTIEKTKPKFALYFAAPYESEYQVGMWIKYLERINLPFIIVLRQPHMLSPIKKLTEAPIFLCKDITSLDYIITKSLTTCFYVNNGMHNSHMVRFPQLCHIQLLHGDSDKTSSYNPITIMFDKIFVSGQVGIDRYLNNNIDISASKFEIVGRPQVEQIKISNNTQASVKTVLYAPTWRGYYQDVNYSSLKVAPEIIKNLLKQDVRVIFRPHPYSHKDEFSKKTIKEIKNILRDDNKKKNSKHIYGSMAEKQMSIYDCFNNCDAMISDVSSVVADFLYSEKPFIVTNMIQSVKNPEDTFPLMKVSYILNEDLSNIDSSINELLNTDAKKEQRITMKSYYLGDFPNENYAENFVKKSREIILNK